MSRTCSVSMWLTSSFRTNSEYASREASGAMSRTSMPDASRARSVRRNVLAKRTRDTESRSARSASSGLTVSTQQSVTLESSSIEGSGDTLGLGLLHDSQRRRAVPEQVPVAQHQIGVQQGAPPRSVVEMQ